MTRKLLSSALLLAAFTSAFAEVDVKAELQRAENGGKATGLVLGNDIRFHWSVGEDFLAYRVNTGRDEHLFFLIDTATGAKSEAFDHDHFAKALGAASGKAVEPNRLPIDTLEPLAPGSMSFRAFGKSWLYSETDHSVSPDARPPKIVEPVDAGTALQSGGGQGGETFLTIENTTQGEIELMWASGHNERKSYGKISPGQSATQQTYAGHLWLFRDAQGKELCGVRAEWH